MTIHRFNLAIGLVGLSLLSGPASASDWPQWRGPFFNGSTDETNLPTFFSKTSNVLWAVELPGPAAATPVVWRDRVFISSTDIQTRSLHALALDRRTGRRLWQHKVSDGYQQDDRSNLAGNSPVTDGRRVIFYYGNGVLAAFDLEGRPLWSTNMGPFAFLWTYSASPLLYEGRLYIQILQRDVPVAGRGPTGRPIESWLVALDPATGRELWRQVRPSEARQESREAYSTPIPHTHAGRPEIFVVGGDCITGHDPATGRELWRWGTWNPYRISHWRLVPSPVAGDGVVLACAPKGGSVYAVKLGLSGNLTDSALAWKSQAPEVSTDVSTPLFYRGAFWVLNSDRRSLACVRPATGEVAWSSRLDSQAKIEASPTGADGKIYLINHRGEVFVAAAQPPFGLLHKVEFGDETDRTVRSSIAVAHGALFIRTGRKLYCVGHPPQASADTPRPAADAAREPTPTVSLGLNTGSH